MAGLLTGDRFSNSCTMPPMTTKTVRAAGTERVSCTVICFVMQPGQSQLLPTPMVTIAI
jgi:hypothetical protein